MRYMQVVTILLLCFFGSALANAEIFIDDFDRPDGPLGPPWELLDQSPLYIENQSVVARENEYGLMLYGEQCPSCYCGEATLLATFNFSTNTDYDGRFQFFIGGGETESDYWGFNAKIGLDEVSLYSIDDANGEIELVTVPSPLMHDFTHPMAFRYDPDTQEVLLVVNGPVSPLVNLAVPASSDPFCFIAMGIENLDATGDEGRIQVVQFQYCCENAVPTVAVELTCLPASGTVPFSTTLAVGLTNQYTGQSRRMAAHIDVLLAGGAAYSNWRAGHTNIDSGGSYTTSWNQAIPVLGSVIGSNVFTLVAEDVTPAPYNQPPYPPSGDTAVHDCTVVANAP